MSEATLKYFNEIVRNRTPTLHAHQLTSVMEKLAWFCNDGSGIGDVFDQWFNSDDAFKIEAVLYAQEILVRIPLEEAELRLIEIGHRWPHLKPKCQNMTEALRNAYSKRSNA